MCDSNGIGNNACRWCGRRETLQGNNYCSPDCFYAAHDADLLHRIYSNDRQALEYALREISGALEELSKSLSGDNLQGVEAHEVLRTTVETLRRDSFQIGERIQSLTIEIDAIERRF